MEQIRKSIEVVAAVLVRDGKFLATQRGYGEFKDFWEFPGGKMEPGESKKEALKREIREELDLEITVDSELMTVEYDYPSFHLTMHCFLCSIASGTPVLREHEHALWLCREDLHSVHWLPADEAVVERLSTSLPFGQSCS